MLLVTLVMIYGSYFHFLRAYQLVILLWISIYPLGQLSWLCLCAECVGAAFDFAVVGFLPGFQSAIKIVLSQYRSLKMQQPLPLWSKALRSNHGRNNTSIRSDEPNMTIWSVDYPGLMLVLVILGLRVAFAAAVAGSWAWFGFSQRSLALRRASLLPCKKWRAQFHIPKCLQWRCHWYLRLSWLAFGLSRWFD